MGLLSSCGAQASHCGGFSCCRAQALDAWASVVAACGLSRCDLLAVGHMGFSSVAQGLISCDLQALEGASFSSCGTWA